MEVVKFPSKEEDQKRDIQEFLEDTKKIAEEEGVTDAVIVTMDAEGNIGLALASTYMDATAMLTIALKSI
jgi:nucleotide-binding universal stress UspA family protein